MLEDAQMCAIHAKRVTIMPKVGDLATSTNTLPYTQSPRVYLYYRTLFSYSTSAP